MDAETFARANWGSRARLNRWGHDEGRIEPRYTDMGWDENYFYFFINGDKKPMLCRVEWVDLVDKNGRLVSNSKPLPLPG